VGGDKSLFNEYEIDGENRCAAVPDDSAEFSSRLGHHFDWAQAVQCRKLRLEPRRYLFKKMAIFRGFRLGAPLASPSSHFPTLLLRSC